MKDQPAVIGISLCRAEGPSKAWELEKYATDYYPSGYKQLDRLRQRSTVPLARSALITTG